MSSGQEVQETLGQSQRSEKIIIKCSSFYYNQGLMIGPQKTGAAAVGSVLTGLEPIFRTQ